MDTPSSKAPPVDELLFRKLYPNFRPKEFVCPCGECDGGAMEHYYLAALQDLRLQMGFPFHITSAFRCPGYNATLPNSSPTSYHPKAVACDISTAALDSEQRHRLLEKAFLRFTGIGIYKNFIHLDLRPVREKSMWWGSY